MTTLPNSKCHDLKFKCQSNAEKYQELGSNILNKYAIILNHIAIIVSAVFTVTITKFHVILVFSRNELSSFIFSTDA